MKTRPPTRFRRARAFTLLEIMVALALVGVLVAGIYSSWYSILKGSEVANRAAIRAQRSRLLKRTLQDSLLCACIFDANAGYYYFACDSDGDFSTLSFAAHLPESFPRSGKFGGLTTRRLTFSVEDSRDGSRQLILRQSPLIMQPDQNEMDFPLVLATDVSQFAVKFRDPKDSKNWITQWANTNTLPKEVYIEITLRDTGWSSARSEDLLAPIDVALPARDVPPDWQAPVNAFQFNQNTNNAGSTNGTTGNTGGAGQGPTTKPFRAGGGR